jgi:uncharacterized integral membrane protein
MLRKLVAGFILIPLAILFVAFAVANRHGVVVTLDPFDQAHPALAVTVPLFALLLGIAIGGVILGGAAAWIRQSRWRRAARLAQGQVRALAAELDRLRQRSDEPDQLLKVQLPKDQLPKPVAQSKYEPQLTIPPPAA